MRGQRFISVIVSTTPRCPRHATALPRYFPPTFTSSTRSYATHRESPRASASGSSSSIHGQTSKSAFDGAETVGPFPLGVGPSGRSKTWKPWKELNVSGKLGRATRQSANLGIILLGGGLFVVLTLSLTTELFASNSPSVLYSSAVDLIRASDALNAHLLPPLKFTHTPHAAAPVRGTTPLSHRLVRHPVSGRDHMILTFYVHGRGRDEPEPMSWAKDAWGYILMYAREAGKYAGFYEEDVIRADVVDKGKEKVVEQVKQVEERGSGWMGKLFGGLSGLRSGESAKTAQRGLPPPGTYTSGEVHGDYVKNANGTYQLLSLIIDVPSSSASYPGRAVVYWSPEADRESLIGKIGARGR
ncbi:hypothetical protein DB88DRAFT_478267 [Papiliotrema laurentii]|uniref:Mitochondrial import inner membrane translocase subunit Tim21 n=1 Tax=Papiliotrema laurentii TaxID=5418 RepID=A0AAD9FWF1_PAPLA|nr:hypothetical protein DB88DRAFT_478267 [Papiliotrema laurentii]